MKNYTLPHAVSLLLLPAIGLSLASASPAAPAKKPAAKKPAAAKPAKPAAKPAKLIHEVLGTQQLAGYAGSLGETFTLGKNSPLNFTLKSAEYSVNRSNVAGSAHFAKGDEKLLVLHYTVQNPQPKIFNYSYSYLNFKAVDADDVTRNYVGDIAREGTGEKLGLALHPGQKIDGYTVIKVGAKGEVPKLIVQHGYETQAPIIRYDLRGKVKKLAKPFADPADAKGATPLAQVPAKAGVFYPVTDAFDAKLDAIAYTTDSIKGRAPGKDKRYCTAIFTIKNGATIPSRYSYSHFRADLKDSDGEKVDYNTSMLKAARDEEAGSELQPGEEARVRFYWELPANVDAKTVLLQYGYDRTSRTYAYDVAGATGK